MTKSFYKLYQVQQFGTWLYLFICMCILNKWKTFMNNSQFGKLPTSFSRKQIQYLFYTSWPYLTVVSEWFQYLLSMFVMMQEMDETHMNNTNATLNMVLKLVFYCTGNEKKFLMKNREDQNGNTCTREFLPKYAVWISSSFPWYFTGFLLVWLKLLHLPCSEIDRWCMADFVLLFWWEDSFTGGLRTFRTTVKA